MIYVKGQVIYIFFSVDYNIMYIDFREVLKKVIKYIVEGLMVAIACFAIPKKSLDIEEIAILALVAAATFSILDTYIPTMGESARTGAGFGIGANLVHFPGGF
jgi:hypothetical protein